MECHYLGAVGGGFPSPAEHWRERALDIQEIFHEHPEATFYLMVRGDSIMWNTNVPSVYYLRITFSVGMSAGIP